MSPQVRNAQNKAKNSHSKIAVFRSIGFNFFNIEGDRRCEINLKRFAARPKQHCTNARKKIKLSSRSVFVASIRLHIPYITTGRSKLTGLSIQQQVPAHCQGQARQALSSNDDEELYWAWYVTPANALFTVRPSPKMFPDAKCSRPRSRSASDFNNFFGCNTSLRKLISSSRRFSVFPTMTKPGPIEETCILTPNAWKTCRKSGALSPDSAKSQPNHLKNICIHDCTAEASEVVATDTWQECTAGCDLFERKHGQISQRQTAALVFWRCKAQRCQVSGWRCRQTSGS